MWEWIKIRPDKSADGWFDECMAYMHTYMHFRKKKWPVKGTEKGNDAFLVALVTEGNYYVNVIEMHS